MWQLSKVQIARKESLILELDMIVDDIEERSLVEYNAALHELNDFIESISSKMEDFYYDKEESWHETHKGKAYNEWMIFWGTYDEITSFENAEEIQFDELPNKPEFI